MKFRFCIATLLVVLIASTASAQTKHALLIGIGDYDTKTTGWSKLNSVRDIEIMKKTLERQNFSTSNIQTVIDKDATRQGIIDAMKNLIGSVKQGSKDVVYIHVSSHGAQLEDDDTNEETDRLDEAIVTINAKWSEEKSEFKKLEAEYLRDDEFGALIEQLRAKLGKEGDVVVVMDLCHSGTVTRGELVARGNKAPLVSANFNQKPKATENLKEFRENGLASRGDNSALATYVVFSAARAEEAAYETYNDEDQKMGTLTYAFSKSLESMQKQTSYRSLFAKIESIMDIKSNIQHPVQEGNGLDRGFWGGQFVVQKPYVEVEHIDAAAKTVKIKAGYFSGVDVGTGVSFYPAGTSDPANAVAITSGKITKASQFDAFVSVDKNVSNTAKDLWAFITEPVFKVKPVVVKVNRFAKMNSRGAAAEADEKDLNAEIQQLKTRLANFKIAKIGTDPADLLLVRGPRFDSLFLANNGHFFGTTQEKSLKDQLRRFSKYKYLKELELKDPSIDVKVQLGKRVNGKIDFGKSDKLGKGLEFMEKDTMVVAVKNNSKFDIWINILDFEPTGNVNPIFPNKGMGNPIQPSELKVEAGKEIVFENYNIVIYPPYGPEVFKIFISDKEIDMEGVAREFKSRNLMSAMEGLVSDIPEMATRGGETVNLKEAKGVVFNIPFQIKPRK